MKKKILSMLDKTKLNLIDFKILILCFEKPRSITQLQGLIGIAYKNLFPHLKKLEENSFILIKDFGRGKPKEVITNSSDMGVFYLVFGFTALWADPSILKSDKKLHTEITRFLKDQQPNK